MTAGWVTSTLVSYGAAAAGLGLLGMDVYETGTMLYENWEEMSDVEIAGVLGPRIAALAGGWFARGAAQRAFRWGTAKGFTKSSLLVGRLRGIKPHRHHAYPRYLGGAEEQRTTKMPENVHKGLTSKMRTYLRGYDAPGHPGRTMDWAPRWKGVEIQDVFGRPRILSGVGDFHKHVAMRFPNAARNFFLMQQHLAPQPGIGWSVVGATSGYSAVDLARALANR
jgi:hypothetical protein